MLYIHLIGRQIRLIASHIFTILKIVVSYIKSHRLISGAGALLIVAAAVGLSYFFATQEVPEGPTARTVELVRAGSLGSATPLSVIGSIRSAREANVSFDTAGTVVGVYRSLGDYVAAGTVLAELKNDSQKAGVAQARAALQKTESAVTVGGIGVDTAGTSYTTAQESARASILATHAAISDAVERRVDQTFSNPGTAFTKLAVLSSNSQYVVNAEAGRVAVEPILTRHATLTVGALGTDGLIAELTKLQEEVVVVQAFIQNVVQALNGALTSATVTEAEIALYRGDAAAALASVNGLSASLAGTIENLKARKAGLAIAETSLSQDATGKSADIAAAEANLAAALANLERTLLRAPISGTINRLDLDVGAFVSGAVPIAYITSAGGLEAVAFVSGSDLADVRTGAKVRVGGTTDGTVVRLGTALDPTTKKAEIRVALPASAPLIAGQSTTLEITRAPRTQSGDTISIPLSALKITPTGPIVFTVNEESLLVAVPVTLGPVRGGSVTIEGVTPETMIVRDARGLKEGQRVSY